MLPKDRRKDEFRKRKTSMEVEHEEREKQFLANLSEQHEIALRRISEIYREKMAATEKSYLQQRQTAMRTREAMMWELEEKVSEFRPENKSLNFLFFSTFMRNTNCRRDTSRSCVLCNATK